MGNGRRLTQPPFKGPESSLACLWNRSALLGDGGLSFWRGKQKVPEGRLGGAKAIGRGMKRSQSKGIS